MTSQQKIHSEPASNTKEKIHHLHQPSFRPVKPVQSSQSLWQQAETFGPGGKEQRIASRGGRGTSPTRRLNDISVVENTPVIPHLRLGHYSPPP